MQTASDMEMPGAAECFSVLYGYAHGCAHGCACFVRVSTWMCMCFVLVCMDVHMFCVGVCVLGISS